MECPPLLKIDGLCVSFRTPNSRDVVHAVRDVSFEVAPGEVFGLAGESGSGKTTLARTILRLQHADRGTVAYRGRVVNRRLSRAEKLDYIRRVQMIFQDPVASINDRVRVYDVLNEGLRNIHPHMRPSERRERIARALEEVGLSPDDMNRYPHMFSGGQLQRIGIARTLLMDPELIVADEPVSALDLSVRGQIMGVLEQLRIQRKLTYIFIGHDLSLMRYFCDRIAIMCAGRLVELGKGRQLFEAPVHPYTQALLSAIPIPNPRVERQRQAPPRPSDRGQLGDRFVEVEPGHFALL